MNRRACVLLLVACLAPVMYAQSRDSAPADPISGVWTDGTGRGLDIKFDGKHTITGTLNPGPNGVPFTSGTFDPRTAVFKIEAERTVKGAKQKIAIDGKLADSKLSGSYETDGQKGTFVFTKAK